MDRRRSLVARVSRSTRLALGLAAVVIAAGAWRLVAAPRATGSSAPAAAVEPAPPPLPSVRRDSYADVIAAVAPSVVTIRVETAVQPGSVAGPDELFRQFFGPQGRGGRQGAPSERRQALGSGVVVASDGYVLTNHHVVADAASIRIDFSDGRSLTGRLVGSDPPSDLALLKVDTTGLPALAFGDSDAVRVGDVALALGNPLGVGQTVTMGIISAKGRATGVGDGSYEDFLQTDAPINHGNSGGALVDARGALIGINAQIVSTTEGNIGIGFAIPAKMAQHVMAALKAEGRVRRGQLGVTAQTVTSDMRATLRLAQPGGVIVADVAEGSAGARAGLLQGDVITAVDGRRVESANALRNSIADTRPGTPVRLDVVRDGDSRQMTATLDEAQAAPASHAVPTADRTAGTLGVTVEPVTPTVAREQGLPADRRGLLVTSVADDSAAARAGLQPGDLIEAVNRRPVTDVAALRRAVAPHQAWPLLLLVDRGGRPVFVTASPS